MLISDLLPSPWVESYPSCLRSLFLTRIACKTVPAQRLAIAQVVYPGPLSEILRSPLSLTGWGFQNHK